MRANVLKKLTPAQRSVVIQTDSGATRAEIARERGVSSQAVKKMLSRARKAYIKTLPADKQGRFRTNPTPPPARVRAEQLPAGI